MMALAYVGKDGEFIVFDCTTWDGPSEAGGSGRYRTERLRAPRDQRGKALHKRHITAFAPSGRRRCISPTCSGYSDLAKRFQWPSLIALETE